MPVDLYDGQPLRYTRKNQSAIVYSVGHNQQDDGGNIQANPYAPKADLGFRLWDVSQRGLPPGGK